MAVHGQPDLVDPRHFFPETDDEIAIFPWSRVSDGVRDIDDRGPGPDRRFEHLNQEVRVGPGGVLGRKLDVPAKGFRQPDGLSDALQDLGS